MTGAVSLHDTGANCAGFPLLHLSRSGAKRRGDRATSRNEGVMIAFDNASRLDVNRRITNISPSVAADLPSFARRSHQYSARIYFNLSRNVDPLVASDIPGLRLLGDIRSRFGRSRGEYGCCQ